MLRFILLSLVLYISVSCETVVDFQLPEQPPRLVVNSIITPDSSIVVEVVPEQEILGGTKWAILDDADVFLYEEGELIEQLPHARNGFYGRTIFRPELGKRYELVVAHQDFDSARAVTMIPAYQASINSLEFLSYTQEESIGLSRQKFTFHIDLDDPAEDNYYALHANAMIRAVRLDPGLGILLPTLERIDLPVESEYPFAGYSTVNGMLFVDDGFSDGQGKLEFSVYLGNQNFEEMISVDIILRHVNRDFYEYWNRVSRQGGFRNSAFIEPAGIYNNIENGYGIFAGFNQEKVTYEF